MRRPTRASRLSVLAIFVFTITAFPGTVSGAPAAPSSNTFVSGPRAGSGQQIALDHVRSHARALGLRAADVADIVVTDDYTDSHTGVTHVYLRQRFGGIEVVDANINVNVARDGSIISLHSSFVRELASKVRGSAGLSAAAAVKSAARQLGLKPPANLRVQKAIGGKAAAVVFARNGISLEPISAKLVYQLSRSLYRLSWQMEIYEPDGSNWWNLRADASTGRILARTDYGDHADDAYNVFALPAENPDEDPRSLVTDPANAASPFGWHDTNGVPGADFTVTRGNNVHAYADRDANNVPDPGSSPEGGPGLTFSFDLDLTLPPVDYQPAAVTNLFYTNNVIHDIVYGYGFDEKSGNFQVNNYVKGGKPGDDVRAEAQDGSGRNNANFFTPRDGFRPRMQMFEWRSSEPNPMLALDGPLAGQTFFGPMAGFGDSLVTTGPREGLLQIVNDGTAPTGDGCQAFTIPAGTIPLIDRGACNFTVKVKNAQTAGAIAAVVANNIPGDPFGMGGADPTITIPSIMISLADANTIKPVLPFNVRISDGTGGAPDRDSDLDNGVIIHEYGHGVSNRLTGGPQNVECLNNDEQMGEGWSDYLALMLTQRTSDTATTSRGIGNYLIFEDASGTGIRPTPYSTSFAINDATYQTVLDETGPGGLLSVPHGLGYVWATMLWEMTWELIDEHDFNADIYGSWETGGNNLALQLVMDGMKFQPCSPGFVQGRNGILDADMALTGGENQCLIWEAFATRGLGFSAEQRSSKKTQDGTAAFDLPAECQGAGGVVVPVGVPAILGQSPRRMAAPRRRRLAGYRRRSR
jgi:extracellular elastinolytic metalloproteinase